MEGASTEPTPAETLRSQSEKVEYVVQRLGFFDPAVEEWVDGLRDTTNAVWQDIAKVTVPKRTQTRTIVLQALSDAGIDVKDALEEGMRFRILDEEHAYAHGLKVKEPREPEIELA
jgi:hypothetical protein